MALKTVSELEEEYTTYVNGMPEEEMLADPASLDDFLKEKMTTAIKTFGNGMKMHIFQAAMENHLLRLLVYIVGTFAPKGLEDRFVADFVAYSEWAKLEATYEALRQSLEKKIEVAKPK